MKATLPAVHPLVVRVTHWINAGAVAIMIGSGFESTTRIRSCPSPFRHS